jgi:hypothetical protein
MASLVQDRSSMAPRVGGFTHEGLNTAYQISESANDEYIFTELGVDPGSGKYVVLSGEKSSVFSKPSDKGHPGMYLLGVTVTVISAGLLAAACVTTFPLSGPISLFALGVLTATSYGIVNDLFACKKCIHYFTNGHTSIHKRLLKTDNPVANAVVWGIHATWILGAIAGTLFAISALATGLVVAPILPYLVTAKIVGSVLAIAYAHYRSVQEEKLWDSPEMKANKDYLFNFGFIKPSNKNFHIVDLSKVPEDKRSAWMGVGARNGAGYTVMPALGVIMLIAITTLGLVL